MRWIVVFKQRIQRKFLKEICSEFSDLSALFAADLAYFWLISSARKKKGLLRWNNSRKFFFPEYSDMFDNLELVMLSQSFTRFKVKKYLKHSVKMNTLNNLIWVN